MRSFIIRGFGVMLVLGAAWWLPGRDAHAQAIIADHLAASAFTTIPDSLLDDIGTDYSFYYVHTSHGSQIITGLEMLKAEDAKYDPPHIHEPGDDLGYNGDTSWVPGTRIYLDAHPECNVAMFSWCAGVSSNTPEGIDIYLNKLQELEGDYPGVTFIYMTGHLDGDGPDGNLYLRNNQIRDTCLSRGNVLFDFADIESYDPDGNYYPDEGDTCGWCYDWCAAHTCPECDSSCAHSHCVNCYLKGKAFWWMMARLAGWGADIPVCGNVNGDDAVNVGDVVHLLNYVFRGTPEPVFPNSGDVNCDGSTNVGDVVHLARYIFQSGPGPCAACP